MTPRVSVITPFLNEQAYLREAIESVKRQTLSDWELILVDDGSTDRSAAIAQAAAREDPRIRVLGPDPSRRGAAVARNRALEVARGEFIAFLDADDLFEPEKLESHVAPLGRHPDAGMVYGATLWWDPTGRVPPRRERMQRLAGRVHRPPSLLSRVILLTRDDVPCVCAALIRRSALEQVGGFEEEFVLYEDQTLWVKLFLTFPVLVVDDCLARYRQHPSSTSAQATEIGVYSNANAHLSRIPFLAWVRRYVEGSAYRDNGPLARALDAASYPYQRWGSRGMLVWYRVRLEKKVRHVLRNWSRAGIWHVSGSGGRGPFKRDPSGAQRRENPDPRP